ncbi:anthranilate synthase component I [Steroidobacter denitrificans]|uniref:Anthranilate synthase component I n=2 Tax=Steroidobacter denitrificans TaxID=465721 RepID=A0A127F9A4_STEDE|nr:anthranilate synthase component I [Steroidobacter denitrificans]
MPDAAELLALHALWPHRYPALLESAAPGEPLGRYDILFACPSGRLNLSQDGRLAWSGGGGHTLTVDRTINTLQAPAFGTFLPALDRWWRSNRPAVQPGAHAPGMSAADPSPSSLPFTGGWLLYLGYELAGQIEPGSYPRAAAGPVAQAIRVPAAIIHEHATHRTWIVAEQSAAGCVSRIRRDLACVTPLPAPPRALLDEDIEEDPPEHYLRMVERALAYIAAGEIYQANLSRCWRARLRAGTEAHHVYQRLRRTNPGPFNAIAMIDEMAVISSSPERLVEVRAGQVSTRPIAGTRPRGPNPAADTALLRELREHPKERAEHIMLIDLERNDLGRICQPGTVRVDEYMSIESYTHVHHIVSNVRGRLREDVSPGEVLAAVFPGGTITGCPKVRCMEIIGELEQQARGAYTGSLGYLNLDGSMDLNILIRSLQLYGDTVSLRAGAGIVADSIPMRELEETRAKAHGVLRALAEAPDLPRKSGT